MFRSLLFALSMFLSGYNLANDQGVSKVAGLDLNQANALQMQLCSLKPGKKMKDYEANFDDYIEWSKANGVETFSLRLTPMFVTQPSNGPSFEWIEFLASPFAISGDAWDKWLTTEEGQTLNANWQSIADCRVTINPVATLYYDETITEQDTRIISMNWCSRLPGVSYDEVQARHQNILANRTPDSPVAAWSIVYNGLGMRNAPGEYMHMLSFANNASLQAYMNNYANNQGWRARVAYETSYASCTGQNVYFAEVLHRPGE